MNDNVRVVNHPLKLYLPLLGSMVLVHSAFARHDLKQQVLDKSKELATGIHIAGHQTLHGFSQPFMLHVAKDFRFRMQADGDMPESDGYDGKTSWHLGGSGVPHVSYRSDRDLTRMVVYVQAGIWAYKGSPIEIVSEKDNKLVIKCNDGQTTAELTLNPGGRTAKTLSCWGPSGTESWTFGAYKTSNDVLIPTKTVHESGETKDVTIVDQLSLPVPPDVDYSVPKPSMAGFTFDPKVSPKIEVKRMFGYLFVKPKLDGKDEGWWFLDTGAEIMVIDPIIARSHKMKVVGKESVSGVVASITTNFSKGVEFTLGPVTIKNSSYMELDMKPFSDGLGIKLAGICGYDFICRTMLDIDPKLQTIGVYPPGSSVLPDEASWTNFMFHGNLPSLTCQFEGNKEGLFSLDTGSGSTVDFFSPSVAKFELLKDRKVDTVMTGGAGGSSESKTGTIEWFYFASKRFEKPKAGFQITTKGGFASPYIDGNIGMGFMSNFRMILDYQSSRLALIPSK